MPVSNGQVANANTFNQAFMDRQADTSTVGKVDLLDPDSGNSGPTISNIQREINSLNAFSGHPLGAAHNATPTWTTNEVGTSVDTVKMRAEALTLKFDEVTGHTHDGSPGNGGPVSPQGLSNTTPGAVAFGRSPNGITFDTTNFFWDQTNFRLGLKTNSPNTALDVNGDFAIRHSDVATAATIAALSTTTSFVRLTGSTVTDLQGIASGFDGKVLILANVSSATVTVSHQDAGATAADRIISPTGADVSLAANNTMILVYDSVQSRWLIVSSSAGTGGGGGTLNVDTKTANYTLSAASDDVILADASGGDFTLTLPTAVGNDGKVFYLKMLDSGIVDIAAQSGEFIDDQATQVMQNQYDKYKIVSDGTGWWIL